MSGSSKLVDPYTLKSPDEFTQKAKNVFDCLTTLEDKHKAFEKTRKDSDDLCKTEPSADDTETIKPAFKAPLPVRRGHSRPQPYSNERYNSRDNRNMRRGGGGSHFRRGGSGGNFRRGGGRMPDFNDGPKSWKKYSLEDIDVLDESKNRQAAYAFLEERRKIREGEAEENKVDLQSTACSKGQFTFSKRKSERMTEKSDTRDKTNEKLRQKFDLDDCEVEDKEDNYHDSETIKTAFKCRKFGKRNIRSRESETNEGNDT